MANAASDVTGVVAGTPVEIGARWPDDRRSRVLRNHQALEGRSMFCALDRQIGFDEERGPVVMQAIHSDGPAWRQRHTLCSDRLTIVRKSSDAEEHIRAVDSVRLRSFVRRRGPATLDRHLSAR